jgi:2-polyprenyl-6-hydroxyphenyl methylase/3-demethylubiquinone-9 3-methyltransferase
MRQISIQQNWDESWKYSYAYDLLEIYGAKNNVAYSYAYKNRRKHTLELIQKVAQPGAKILDVAAAQGNFSLMLAELGYEVTWNDLREKLVGYVKEKWEYGTIHYAPGNVFSLKFDNYFDVILVAEVIEHVAHPDEFLKNISRMLKPKGHIVISTPNGEYFKNRLPKFSDCSDPSQFEAIQFKPDADGHIFLLHLDELEPIAQQANLEISEIQVITNSVTNGHLKLSQILKFIPEIWINRLEQLTQRLPLWIKRKLSICTIVLLTHSHQYSRDEQRE